MRPLARNARLAGFTFVELLLALALGTLAAATVALLLRAMLASGSVQTERLGGSFAARAALRTLSRDVSCAFAPPVKGLPPLRLETSTEPGKPSVRLEFYVPVLEDESFPGAYDVHAVAYEVRASSHGRSDFLRISAPCSGPYTNAPVTNLLFHGRFSLAAEIVDGEKRHSKWPPPEEPAAALPSAIRLSLSLRGENQPLVTEALIQAAASIRSPVERKRVEDPAEQHPPPPEGI